MSPQYTFTDMKTVHLYTSEYRLTVFKVLFHLFFSGLCLPVWLKIKLIPLMVLNNNWVNRPYTSFLKYQIQYIITQWPCGKIHQSAQSDQLAKFPPASSPGVFYIYWLYAANFSSLHLFFNFSYCSNDLKMY